MCEMLNDVTCVRQQFVLNHAVIIVEDKLSSLIDKNHWGYFTALNSELNECLFLFFYPLNLTFLSLV